MPRPPNIPVRKQAPQKNKTKNDLYLQSLLRQGLAHQQKDQLKQAQLLYEQILRIEPGHFDALQLLGLIALTTKRNEHSLVLLNKALAINKSNPHVFYNRGLVLGELGQDEAAMASYERAIAIKPDYAVAHANLGNLLQKCKKYDHSLASYDQAIAISPDYADAYFNRGVVFEKIKKFDNAIRSYCLAIDINPANKDYWNSFSVCLPHIDFSDYSETVADYVVRLLNKNIYIRPATALLCILRLLNKNKLLSDLKIIDKFQDDASSILRLIENLNAIPLLIKILQLTPIADPRYEKSLSIIRKFFLINYSKKTGFSCSKEVREFQCVLAQQCFINEYVYFESEDEANLIDSLENEIQVNFDNLKPVDLGKVITLATYKPLHKFSWARNIFEFDDSVEYQRMLRIHVKEYDEERFIRSSIQVLSTIENKVSNEVRSQYEVNPYPRWISTQLCYKPIDPKDIFDRFNLDKSYINNELSIAPEILIAGCGTGQHSVSAASIFKNSKITAIDLSLSSLSYAIRKTIELRIENIKYLQADILDLKKLGKKFDIVESSGVLHHMADPVAGWKVLVDCTNSNGLMKIGLYSEIARRNIVAARELISRRNLGSSINEIRMLRNEVINSSSVELINIQGVSEFLDFYSISDCRDLLFHTQEHRFNLIEIDHIVKDLGMKFLGFEFSNNSALINFRHKFPSASEFSLLDWHKFELEFPNTFVNMYQFWLIK